MTRPDGLLGNCRYFMPQGCVLEWSDDGFVLKQDKNVANTGLSCGAFGIISVIAMMIYIRAPREILVFAIMVSIFLLIATYKSILLKGDGIFLIVRSSPVKSIEIPSLHRVLNVDAIETIQVVRGFYNEENQLSGDGGSVTELQIFLKNGEKFVALGLGALVDIDDWTRAISSVLGIEVKTYDQEELGIWV